MPTKTIETTANDVIRARIPAEEKAAFEAVLAKIGLDTSSFLRMAVRQTILQQAVPFPMVAQKQPPELTDERLESIVNALNTRFDKAMRTLAE